MNQRVRMNGVLYESVGPLRFTHDIGRRGTTITTDPPRRKLVNKCEHCHRGDIVDDAVGSVEEAVGRGWLRIVEEAS